MRFERASWISSEPGVTVWFRARRSSPRAIRLSCSPTRGWCSSSRSFSAQATPPIPRVADSQKCLRLSGKHNDLEQVGRDTYHHTLFEMLGNWSFGDYYKRRGDRLGLGAPDRRVWKLPKDQLYATVYTTDDEAEAPLAQDHRPARRARSGASSARTSGRWARRAPAGRAPRSTSIAARRPATARAWPVTSARVNGDCARYIELWNLVFIQYNREPDGSLRELPSKHVDTGMGLERIVAVLQGVLSNYDTDLFRLIIAATETLAGTPLRRRSPRPTSPSA